MSDQVRILIVDDHPIVRSGMRLLLDGQQTFEVVGEATSHEATVDLVRTARPDVIIIECMMADINSLQLTRDIKKDWPNVNILAITIHRDDDHFLSMLKAGASGYILKDAEPEDLFEAIQVVSQGDVWLPPSMAHLLVQQLRLRAGGSGHSEISTVTSREKEILRLLAEGHSVNEIAQLLIISPSTVHTHRSNIMAKLGLNSQYELIQLAKKQGLINNH